MRNDIEHGTAQLARLSDLDDFKIAKGDPDIRGWEVKATDGRTLGKVDDLIVDTGAMRVRYFELKGDKKALGLDDDQHLLIPIGTARLDEKDDNVFIDRLPAGGFARAPLYTRGKLNREYETSLRSAYGTTETKGDFYGNDLYEDRRFFGKRRQGREGNAYLTRSEEELIGRRQAKAGDERKEEPRPSM